MKFLKNNWRVILIFIVTFLIYEFFGFVINGGDPINSYAFSHAIRVGEVPYRDFNTISPPLYAFIQSLGLFIYDDFIMFLLTQSLLVSIMFYLLFKLYDKKAWLVFLSMIVFMFIGFLQTYNFCCIFMLVIILYLEKKYPDKDFLIGIFIALASLSKHTVGLFFVIPTLIFYWKQPKKIHKRVIGFLIPWLILIIYLLFNKALFAFIDLCFLGLFDFGKENGHLLNFWFVLSIILLILNILMLKKNKNNITYYYLLFTFFFAFPLFDRPHFAFYFECFSIAVVEYINKLSKYLFAWVISLSIFFIFYFFIVCHAKSKVALYKNVNHYKYYYSYVEEYDYMNYCHEFINNYASEDPLILSYISMKYKTINDMPITEYDVLFYGNHGYNGTKKIIDKISNMHNKYIIINILDYEDKNIHSQINKDVIKYVIDNSKKIDSNDVLAIYYKE